MRIVHTSDWHVGRVWKGLNRKDEIEATLDNLADFIVRESVDLVLVSGDLFDNSAPVAWAERAVFAFFKRIGLAGVPSVVIAGNHDSPARLDAWGQLAELVRVHAVGMPRPPDKGGVVEIQARSGERAMVAALPFAPPRRLVTALEIAHDDTAAAQGYADRMRRILEHLTKRFRKDAINLVCAHTHLDQAIIAGSERRVHLGDDWAVTAQALPHDAHYVALGHIHKPQRVEASPSPTMYAGSPMQMDFGEEGEDKSFVLVEAKPGQPARLERIRYEGGKTLHTVTETLAGIEARADELRTKGWLRVKVKLDELDVDINRKVRGLLPNVVAVDIELPEREGEVSEGTLSLADNAASEVFRAHYRRRHGVEPSDGLIRLFEELEEQCSGASEHSGDEAGAHEAGGHKARAQGGG